MCAAHPNAPAVHYCANCQMPLCATCDFSLPGGMHLCPACVTATPTTMAPGRRKTAIWSLVLAIWVTLGFIGTMIGFVVAESPEDAEVIGGIAGFVVMIPNLIGLGLGIASFERRGVNPWWLWLATIWNGVTMSGWLLLCTVGLLMG